MKKKDRQQQAKKVTIQGMFINLGLSALKFLAGMLGHSAAMVADAVHSLSDTATDLVVLFSLRLSSKPADKDHAYGHGRIETLATAVIALSLAWVGFEILSHGVHSIIGITQGNTLPAPGFVALLAAIISIIVKEWLYRYTLTAAKATDSQTLLANAWHHRSDALSSIGTLVGIGGAYFLGPQWTLLDPLAAVIVSLFIFEASWQILKKVWQELTDGSLDEQTVREIKVLASQVQDVIKPHDIKTRRIGPHIAIELHIYVQAETPFVRVHEITENVEHALRRRFGRGTFITVHPEPLENKPKKRHSQKASAPQAD